jgi:hypothetical protein
LEENQQPLEEAVPASIEQAEILIAEKLGDLNRVAALPEIREILVKAVATTGALVPISG